MKLDPKILLGAFETEEEQLLELPSTKYKKKKSLEAGQISNKAVLSFCLMTGITAGVGAAQANASAQTQPAKVSNVSKEEIPMNNMPPDEPLSNSSDSKTMKDLAPKQDQSSTPSEDIPMDYIPPDEPIQNPSIIQQNPRGNSEKQSPNEKITKQRKIEKEKNSNKSNHEGEKTEQKSTKASTSLKKEKDVPKPKTVQGAELPDTAGNDLTSAIGSVSVALTAGIYLATRKRKNVNEMG